MHRSSSLLNKTRPSSKYARPLVHVGYPKTASTWLQQTIFNDEKNGFYAHWGLPSGEATEQFVLANGFRFSAQVARRVFETGLETATKRHLVPVLSQETLVGSQIRGRYWGKEVADRIHQVLPEARIFILIREQKSMILSSYREHIKMGGITTIERFIGMEKRNPGFGALCRLDFLEYDLLISYYQQLFGKENVLVLPFELLKRDRELFLQKLSDFSSLALIPDTERKAHNVGFKGATVELRRKLNYFFQSDDFGGGKLPLNWRVAQKISTTFDRIVPQPIHDRAEGYLKECIDEAVGDSFAKSNHRTSQLIDTNLLDFGYS